MRICKFFEPCQRIAHFWPNFDLKLKLDGDGDCRTDNQKKQRLLKCNFIWAYLTVAYHALDNKYFSLKWMFLSILHAALFEQAMPLSDKIGPAFILLFHSMPHYTRICIGSLDGNALWWYVHFSVTIQTILAHTLDQFNQKNCIPVCKSNDWLTDCWTLFILDERFSHSFSVGRMFWNNFTMIMFVYTWPATKCLNSIDWLLGRAFPTRDSSWMQFWALASAIASIIHDAVVPAMDTHLSAIKNTRTHNTHTHHARNHRIKNEFVCCISTH